MPFSEMLREFAAGYVKAHSVYRHARTHTHTHTHSHTQTHTLTHTHTH